MQSNDQPYLLNKCRIIRLNDKQRIKRIIEAKKKMNHEEYLSSGGEPFEKDQMFAISNHKGQKISLIGDVPTLAYYYKNQGNQKGYNSVLENKSKNWRVIADGAVVGKTDNYNNAGKIFEKLTGHNDSVVHNDQMWSNNARTQNPRNPKRRSKWDN